MRLVLASHGAREGKKLVHQIARLLMGERGF
jgi:hypothetical protein